VSRLAALSGFLAPNPYATIESILDAQMHRGRAADAHERVAAPRALGS